MNTKNSNWNILTKRIMTKTCAESVAVQENFVEYVSKYLNGTNAPIKTYIKNRMTAPIPIREKISIFNINHNSHVLST